MCMWVGVYVVSLSASEIDVHVGTRLRLRREALGISQGNLGRHLGLTFSQIQKYEKGSNRIGAGRLYQIAKFLGVSISHFFEGLNGDRSDPVVSTRASGASGDELRQLADAFSSISDNATRAAVLALLRSLPPMSNGRNTVCQ